MAEIEVNANAAPRQPWLLSARRHPGLTLPVTRSLSLPALTLFTFYFLFFTLSVSAQDDPNEIAPPPLKAVSKDEKTRLLEAPDVKAHTKLALDMMNSRLVSAEKLSAANDFEGMFRELGYFHGLMENGLDFLIKRDTGAGKVLDNFKRLEIGLRGFVPRLETIRRELPPRFEDYVRKLIISVRDTRAKAVDPMFSDTVTQKPNP